MIRDRLIRLALVVVAAALFVTATVTAMAPRAWGIVTAHDQRPVDLTAFSGLAQRSTVVDAMGRQIGVYQLENSQPLDIDEVPEPVLGAFLAVEDAGFYAHRGTNLRAFARALLSNASGTGRQGASTITMQVVKNEFLGDLPRDARYKVLQARYATMLEKQLDKREILERYLTTIYFGNNAYGLPAAAETYFGARPAELSLEQGAFLAGLVQAPSTYDPIEHPEASRRRYAEVLDRLVEEGLLDAAGRAALGTAPRGADLAIPRSLRAVERRSVARTYFTEAVKDELLNRSDALGATYQERYNALFRGGLRIFTTLDAAAQRDAERAVAAQLPDNAAGITAALVSLDVRSGAVRAMVGGPGFTPGQDEVNLALRRRQTGSSVKIFILAAALEAGVLPDDVIDGTLPCTLPNPGKPEEPFEIAEGVSEPPGTLRRMTWLSINCAYAKLSQIVGLERVVERMYDMTASQWLTRATYKIWPFASLATGGNELSPMDMASGAQTLANGGLHLAPYLVERVEGPTGNVIWTRPAAEPVRALGARAAWDATDVLRGVLTRGTARRTPLEGERPAAGKTGTQDNNTNAWFVGYTPQLATAVWVGDPKAYTKMRNIPEFVADPRGSVPRVQGATYPARIWKDYMDAAHEALPIEDFGPPPDASTPVRSEPARLYLPGVECVARVVAGTLPPPSTTAPAGRRTTATTTTVAPADAAAPQDTVVVSVLEPGTTIAPTNTNPYEPVPSTDLGVYVRDCAAPLPRGVQTTVAP
ncbi:MAG: hypothetical protein RL283_1456 [Actinomycetota bacterium]